MKILCSCNKETTFNSEKVNECSCGQEVGWSDKVTFLGWRDIIPRPAPFLTPIPGRDEATDASRHNVI